MRPKRETMLNACQVRSTIAVVDGNSRLHFVRIAIASTDGGLKPGTDIAMRSRCRRAANWRFVQRIGAISPRANARGLSRVNFCPLLRMRKNLDVYQLIPVLTIY